MTVSIAGVVGAFVRAHRASGGRRGLAGFVVIDRCRYYAVDPRGSVCRPGSRRAQSNPPKAKSATPASASFSA
jgi:hypothetical protein